MYNIQVFKFLEEKRLVTERLFKNQVFTLLLMVLLMAWPLREGGIKKLFWHFFFILLPFKNFKKLSKSVSGNFMIKKKKKKILWPLNQIGKAQV